MGYNYNRVTLVEVCHESARVQRHEWWSTVFVLAVRRPYRTTEDVEI